MPNGLKWLIMLFHTVDDRVVMEDFWRKWHHCTFTNSTILVIILGSLGNVRWLVYSHVEQLCSFSTWFIALLESAIICWLIWRCYKILIHLYLTHSLPFCPPLFDWWWKGEAEVFNDFGSYYYSSLFLKPSSQSLKYKTDYITAFSFCILLIISTLPP